MPAEIATIKQRVAAGLQPEKDAYQHLLSSYVAHAMSGSPKAYTRHTQAALWTRSAPCSAADRRRPRPRFALAVVQKYAQKAPLAAPGISSSNAPTRWADAELADFGQLQSYGSTYAYDLTWRVFRCQQRPHHHLFHRMSDALQTSTPLTSCALHKTPAPSTRVPSGALDRCSGTASSTAFSPCSSRPPAWRSHRRPTTVALADKILNDPVSG